jgi:hypothetical protein
VPGELFLQFTNQKGWLLLTLPELLTQLETTPSWRLAAWLAAFVANHTPSQGRNVYSAFLALPGTQQLRFEPSLRVLKQTWNAAIPRYDAFYRVDFLLGQFLDQPLPTAEDTVRERLILLVRFLCLFRGIDLERCHNQVHFKQGGWFLSMRRKGQRHWGSLPCP